MLPLRTLHHSNRPTYVTYFIIVLCAISCICIFFSIHGYDDFVQENCFIPEYIFQITMRTFFNDAFFTTVLHADFSHYFFNMWFLFVFGPSVEERMGPVKYFMCFWFSSVFGLMTYILFHRNGSLPILGASAGVSGILGAYALNFYQEKTLVVLPYFYPIFFEIKSIIYMIFWFGGQVAFGVYDLALSKHRDSNIAFLAHVGGFIFGFVFAFILAKFRFRSAVKTQ